MAGRIACHTLGCKVNQFDTEAMLELFERAGYTRVDFDAEAEIYLINTCTVTGVGDQKSMKCIRRIHREHPNAAIIVAGCLAERDAARVTLPGVVLTIGVKRRSEVVALYERAMREGRAIDAVGEGGEWTFENLWVSRHEGHTRATLKIQEGCDRYCAYCVIPYVRGPIRSMPLAIVSEQAARLAQGYPEIVVTGIHLASYGRGMGLTLTDAIRAVSDTSVARIRLGSLEPGIVTDEFVQAIAAMPKVMEQFHLSMQSGSAGVLGRMRRRYTPEEYLLAARRLQSAYPHAAITTDVLTGFPGETDEEARETEAFLEAVGFARIHVFPYSRRAGTVADRMPDQVPEPVKHERCLRLIAIGNRLEEAFVEQLIGTSLEALLEEEIARGVCEGYTREYVRIRARGVPGEIVRVTPEKRVGNILC